MRRRTIAAVAVSIAAMALAGCGSQPSERDRAALDALAFVAATTSTVDPALVDWTECWLPSDHLLPEEEVGSATIWRVMCRVHWHERDGEPRYQDTNCIGDFAAEPMLDHCYRYAHYDLMPVYDDHPGIRAG